MGPDLGSEAKKRIVSSEPLLLSELHEFLLAQNLGTDDVLPPVLLALNDAVVDRAVSLAQMLGSFTGTSGADRRDARFGQRGARERPDRRGAASFLAPAGYRFLTHTIFFSQLLVGLMRGVISEIRRTGQDGHSFFQD